MKYTSYVLSVIGIVLLLNIFLSYSSGTYRTFLKDTKSKMMGVTNEEVIVKMNKDQIEINTKILNSIDKLNDNLDKIGKKEITREITINSGSTSSGNTISGNELLDLPGTLVGKLMPKINPKKIENEGVFGIKNEKFYEAIKYATYYDEKKKIKIFVFDKSYPDMLSNFKLTNLYKINEADTFFGYTFFLNPLKKDLSNRFVTLFEGNAVGFEVEKTNYEILKKSLLN
ncbi:MAG: hypothetical protein PHZ26_04080 [Candidatus Gracilibacteria bacterium]|nr:hypothetical protein [Candidatus Gracilibacteria bacterium]MDD2908907.1 hypothetical protein [Candidatus Gracilibacteria bacterium]